MTLLAGRRVLLVEDESLVAMLAEDMLLDLGCEVAIAMRLNKALDLVQSGSFDLAVLDVNLGDAHSYPVADLLNERGTPFLFATGYGQQGLEGSYRNVPVLQKPYQAEPLEHLLVRLLTSEVAPLLDCSRDLPPSCRCQDAQAGGNRFRADQVR
ncbi:response regulator [Methylobacterium sp. E-005]|uniref:response regulator n=1 Tax=Methylobacterium sp. E-005 TaxID=2836549 RepID=UPI001FBA69F6|nr:response regulator [Methylobacterium sp. E-005]MCJ2088488.1 response regulator [Methylobacterium sp. E-005]